MGFFIFFNLLFFLNSPLSWASESAESSGLSLACFLKEGADPEIAFSLSLKPQEVAETAVSPLSTPKISYSIKATYQDVMVGDLPKAALDYRIEKTDDGKKIRSWKFPRELIAKTAAGLVLKIKGKNPQNDLKITCKSGGT